MTQQSGTRCGWCEEQVGAWLRLEPGVKPPSWLSEPVAVCWSCWQPVRPLYRDDLRRGLIRERAAEDPGATPSAVDPLQFVRTTPVRSPLLASR